jgi:hypothetical protein
MNNITNRSVCVKEMRLFSKNPDAPLLNEAHDDERFNETRFDVYRQELKRR